MSNLSSNPHADPSEFPYKLTTEDKDALNNDHTSDVFGFILLLC